MSPTQWPRVPHGLSFWRGESPRHSATTGLVDVSGDVVGSPLLSVPTDLSNHHHGVGSRVLLERLQRIDVRRADDRIAHR
jgi:hypothetical protein